MIWYTIATLLPACTLVLACLLGGVWPFLAVASITVMVFFLDKLPIALQARDAPGHGTSVAQAVAHLALLPLGIWALAGDDLNVLDKVFLFTGLGLYFGQVSNANAHALIHVRRRGMYRLGVAIYVSLLHGHHVSAHLRVHHVFAATDADPNSARLGQGFWGYALHVLWAEFTAGLHAETHARVRGDHPIWTHPYLIYVGGGAALLGLAFALAGWAGVFAHLCLALYAQMQLLLSDYVQHYGLRRRTSDNGKAEPIGPQHSWNAPEWYSSAMMLNAPRHSDHHMRPARPYPALEITKDMPMLPHSLPVMAVIALVPPLWHRVMDRRVARWQNPA